MIKAKINHDNKIVYISETIEFSIHVY